MRIWREIPPKAQSADTSREGSTGTCECTRLSFTGATKYFVWEPAAATRNAGDAARSGRSISFAEVERRIFAARFVQSRITGTNHERGALPKRGRRRESSRPHAAAHDDGASYPPFRETSGP